MPLDRERFPTPMLLEQDYKDQVDNTNMVKFQCTKQLYSLNDKNIITRGLVSSNAVSPLTVLINSSGRAVLSTI